MLESAAMPKTTRVSVTIDRALLDELKQLAGEPVKLSALFTQAVRDEINRLGMLELLAEMEREDPISPEGRAAGDRLWKRICLSWTQAYYRSLRNEALHSG
ncbi:MAG TPA: hypothetical protein VHS78_19460 [Candidatus Elarobacter sp.]|jgi:hypothetical protein|nr:hypothetical protein [Candidatus Elarobacter sp.]